jgi:hypothetical protein
MKQLVRLAQKVCWFRLAAVVAALGGIGPMAEV